MVIITINGERYVPERASTRADTRKRVCIPADLHDTCVVRARKLGYGKRGLVKYLRSLLREEEGKPPESRKSIYLPPDLFDLYKRKSIELGYGERGLVKLLRKLAESL